MKRRKNLLKKTKGYRWGRKSKPKLAKVAAIKAGVHAYNDRRKKKRTTRNLWNIKINAAARERGMTYGTFMRALKNAKIELNRKMLAELAEHEPKAFEAIVKKAVK